MDLFTSFGHKAHNLVSNLHANLLNFDIGLKSYIVNVISNGYFSTLGYNVEDVLAFHKVRTLDARKDVSFIVGTTELEIFVLFLGLFEEFYPIVVDEISEEALFFLSKEESSFIFKSY